MGLLAASNITSYWSNRRGCDAPSASSALAAADPDAEPDSPVAADSAPKALFRIQTGQNSLSAVATKFVPQTGQVRDSRCTNPNPLPGSPTAPPGSAFTASAVLRRRLAYGSRPEFWQPGPRYLPLSCRSLSSRLSSQANTSGSGRFLHFFSSGADTQAPQIDGVVA